MSPLHGRHRSPAAAPCPAPDSPSGPRPSPASWAVAAVAVVCFAVACGLVFYNLSLPNGLYGVTEFDDGVYVGAAIHLISGQLPYRDFVFVQPPGITVLLAPVAFFWGHLGAREVMAVARILTGVVAGTNCVLVVLLLRHRGLLAAGCAGLLLAIFPPAYTADHTVMLEPYCVLFCLIGALCCFKAGELAGTPRLIAGGVAFGIAGSVKAFAIALVVALVVVLAFRGRRGLLWVLGGTVIGFAVVCLPFFLLAPHAFVHDVVSSQLGRSTTKPTPLSERVAATTGLRWTTTARNLPLGPDSPWPVLSGTLLAALVVLGGVVPALLRRRDTLTWFCFATAASTFGLILLPAEFFDHYAYLPATFLALSVGCVIANATEPFAVARRRATADGSVPARPGRTARPAIAAGALVACAVLLGSLVVVRIESGYERTKTLRFGDPGPAVAAAIPKGACALADAESILISADRVSTAASCPVIDDSTGTWLSFDPGNPPVRAGTAPKDPALVSLWQSAFSRVRYVTFAGRRAFRVPFTVALRRWFDDHFARVPGASQLTYVRRTVPLKGATGMSPA